MVIGHLKSSWGNRVVGGGAGGGGGGGGGGGVEEGTGNRSDQKKCMDDAGSRNMENKEGIVWGDKIGFDKTGYLKVEKEEEVEKVK